MQPNDRNSLRFNPGAMTFTEFLASLYGKVEVMEKVGDTPLPDKGAPVEFPLYGYTLVNPVAAKGYLLAVAVERAHVMAFRQPSMVSRLLHAIHVEPDDRVPVLVISDGSFSVQAGYEDSAILDRALLARVGSRRHTDDITVFRDGREFERLLSVYRGYVERAIAAGDSVPEVVVAQHRDSTEAEGIAVRPYEVNGFVFFNGGQDEDEAFSAPGM